MPDLDSQVGLSHPTGVIVMWSGFLNDIPSGYKLADGNNGTVNMIDFFVRGNPPSGTVDAIIGSHTHVLAESELPIHTHTPNGFGHRHRINVNTIPTTPKGQGSIGFRGNNNAGTYQFKNEFANISLSSIGSSQPHNNQPPYYELAYIQKVST